MRFRGFQPPAFSALSASGIRMEQEDGRREQGGAAAAGKSPSSYTTYAIPSQVNHYRWLNKKMR